MVKKKKQEKINASNKTIGQNRIRRKTKQMWKVTPVNEALCGTYWISYVL